MDKKCLINSLERGVVHVYRVQWPSTKARQCSRHDLIQLSHAMNGFGTSSLIMHDIKYFHHLYLHHYRGLSKLYNEAGTTGALSKNEYKEVHDPKKHKLVGVVTVLVRLIRLYLAL